MDHPEQPLEAGALHPAGGTGATAGDQVERAADADGDRNGEPVPVAGYPLVLFRMSESDEEDVGTALLFETRNDQFIVVNNLVLIVLIAGSPACRHRAG